jgi:hypothetical protein
MAAAPVWKIAYRLVLSREGEKARLQGWAMVENLTGGDWNDIELVLISGNPLTLRHPLYTAFFTDRIEVPVTTSARLQPRTDDADDYDNAYVAGVSAHLAQSAGPVRHASVQQLEQRMAREVAAMRPPAAMAAPPPRLGAAANAAETGEASTQLLYCFPGRMSLTTGHTMMVPFVDHEVPAVLTWLYQPETSARHPLAAVRLRNDGDSGLPQGIVTARRRRKRQPPIHAAVVAGHAGDVESHYGSAE